jgi:hypothetical protein
MPGMVGFSNPLLQFRRAQLDCCIRFLIPKPNSGRPACIVPSIPGKVPWLNTVFPKNDIYNAISRNNTLPSYLLPEANSIGLLDRPSLIP